MRAIEAERLGIVMSLVLLATAACRYSLGDGKGAIIAELMYIAGLLIYATSFRLQRDEDRWFRAGIGLVFFCIGTIADREPPQALGLR